jgi:hypothetical protein
MNTKLGLVSIATAWLGVFAATNGCSSDESEPAPAHDAGSSLEAAVAMDVTASPPSEDVDASDAAAACAPGDVSGFRPTWKPPVALHQAQCTPAQIALLADCVWSHPGRDDAACKTFLNSKAAGDLACLKCGYTTTSGTKLGAIVSNGTSVQVNYAGCIALVTGDVSPAGCGASVQAAALCQDEACVATCSTFEELVDCEAKAERGVCKAYTDAAACASESAGDGGPASVCNPDTQDFGVRVAAYADLFCGDATADAGPDASDDAAASDAADASEAGAIDAAAPSDAAGGGG